MSTLVVLFPLHVTFLMASVTRSLGAFLPILLLCIPSHADESPNDILSHEGASYVEMDGRGRGVSDRSSVEIDSRGQIRQHVADAALASTDSLTATGKHASSVKKSPRWRQDVGRSGKQLVEAWHRRRDGKGRQLGLSRKSGNSLIRKEAARTRSRSTSLLDRSYADVDVYADADADAWWRRRRKVRGARGAKGPKGAPGFPGWKGAEGSKGLKGPRGENAGFIAGPPGFKGPHGDPTKSGPPGKKGLKGEKGEEGQRGPPGREGELGEGSPSIFVVDCQWEDGWAAWEPCSVTCDWGFKRRDRSIKMQPQGGGRDCDGDSFEIGHCTGPPCHTPAPTPEEEEIEENSSTPGEPEGPGGPEGAAEPAGGSAAEPAGKKSSKL